MPKIRGKMPVSERAKQFMPFKAVSGLDEALERKRIEFGIVERKELSEEELKKLDIKFQSLSKGDSVCITYYTDAGYKDIFGDITEISLPFRLIKINDTMIKLDDITEIF